MDDRLGAGDPLLAGLFDAATAPAEAPLPGEAEALAVFRVAGRRAHRPAALIAAAVFGGAVMIGGVAAAATGSMSLPGISHGRATPPPTASPATAPVSDAGQGAGIYPGVRPTPA